MSSLSLVEENSTGSLPGEVSVVTHSTANTLDDALRSASSIPCLPVVTPILYESVGRETQVSGVISSLETVQADNPLLLNQMMSSSQSFACGH